MSPVRRSKETLHQPFASALPQHRVLLVALRHGLGGGGWEDLQAALAEVADWDGLLKSALDHGVFPSLGRVLSQRCPEAVPPAALAEMRRFNQGTARRALRLTGELLKILALLESHAIPAIPLKGPVLAQVAYGDLTLRQFSDLDLLVRPQDFRQARNLLFSAGYRQEHALTPRQEQVQFRRFYDLSFLHPERNKLELHWRLLDHQGGGPDAAAAFAGKMPVTLAGKTVYSLAPADLLLFLCLHATYHRWERLSYLNDVARLLQAQGPWDWPDLLAKARQAGLRRMLLLGVSLARELLGAPVPDEVQAQARRDSGVAALWRQVRANLFQPERGERFVARNLFHLRARERLKDRLAYTWSRVGIPMEDDWEWVPLPDSLYWLYYGVRPLRQVFQGLLSPLWRRLAHPGPPLAPSFL
jgi:hypothetical protein